MAQFPESSDPYERLEREVSLVLANIRAALIELNEVSPGTAPEARQRCRAKSDILKIRRAYLEVVLQGCREGYPDALTRDNLLRETTFNLKDFTQWHIVNERHLEDQSEQVDLVRRLTRLARSQGADIRSVRTERDRLVKILAKIRRVCRTFLQMASPAIMAELDDLAYDPEFYGDLDDHTTDPDA